ncbi:MAG: type I restriction enzyme HsdR N-terminal domain-containing protein [Schwartzia sp.]|nr:type I restriction enzyme HsdR N-terminal domain-containing protein [Schwartzia sp. (in: firmicutes)]
MRISKQQIQRIRRMQEKHRPFLQRWKEANIIATVNFEIEDYDFADERLPAVETIDDVDYYYDTIRQKPIRITPEETVRQEVVSFLIDKSNVPVHMLRVEESLAHHVKDCLDRSDVVIMRMADDHESVVPLAVIECKREELELDDNMIAQAQKYAEQLKCSFFMLTNGKKTLCFHRDADNNVLRIKSFRKYTAMLNEEYTELPAEAGFERRSLDEIRTDPTYFVYDVTPYEMGTETVAHEEKLIFCSNLWECLLDDEYALVPYEYDIFTLLKDYGVRRISWGNASGGSFNGCRCRSFRISYQGKTKIVSLAFSDYTATEKDQSKTGLFVIVETNGRIHSSLQIPMDAKNVLQIHGSMCSINHTGKITVGATGAGKISDLRRLVQQDYPKIIDGQLFKLGILPTNRILRLCDEAVCDFIENIISYTLIRDDYREIRLREVIP